MVSRKGGPPSAGAGDGDLVGGRYRLIKHVAKGGMADVWLADDTYLGRTVAVKVLRDHVAADPTMRERFRREAVAMASIVHPNVVAVYDCIDHDGREAVIMEYVEGKSLRDVLNARKKLTPQLTTHIGQSIAAALHVVHGKNLVHRDVKPGNILVTPQGMVKLADFGIAKSMDGGINGADDLTADHIMMGTAKYLAPEQVKGVTLDGRADLYSLGIVLYECLAGRPPFIEQTDAETALARLRREPTPLGSLRPSISPQLTAVIHTLLRRNRDHRYADGLALRAALDHAVSGTLDHTLSMTPPSGIPVDDAGAVRPSAETLREITQTIDIPVAPVRRRTGLAATLALMVLAVAGFVVWQRAALGPATGSIDLDGAALVDIVRVASFDPNGNDGQENDEALPLAVDGDRSTAWTSTCYATPTFGVKQHVGVILELASPSAGQLLVAVGNDDWQIAVHAATSTIPATLDGWGVELGTAAGDKPGEVLFEIPVEATSLLVLFTGVSADDSCAPDNPYRAELREATFLAG